MTDMSHLEVDPEVVERLERNLVEQAPVLELMAARDEDIVEAERLLEEGVDDIPEEVFEGQLTLAAPLGVDLFGDPVRSSHSGLRGAFTFPPFSVMNANTGEWRQRKEGWLAYGIKSELGRAHDGEAAAYTHMSQWMGEQGMGTLPDISIFDPVLCELAYSWFCPKYGKVLDPFAGGSVRGIMAGLLDRHYLGIDLRPEQIEANQLQAEEIKPPIMPRWLVGDSLETLADPLFAQTQKPADMLFTCPPYHDLEVYSDDPRDISNMTYDEFMQAYTMILTLAVEHLADNRFAAIVVGDIRDKKGHYRNFVGDTVEACKIAGLSYYNEGILVKPAAGLAVFVGKQFKASRKFAKTHQNVLIFVKGDGKAAAAAIEASEATPTPEA